MICQLEIDPCPHFKAEYIFFNLQDKNYLRIIYKLGLNEFLIISENQLAAVRTNEDLTRCS